MLNLLAGTGLLGGMFDMIVPFAVDHVRAKLQEEEITYGGPVVFTLTNQSVEGKITTLVKTYGYKTLKPELLSTVDLTAAIADPQMLSEGLKSVTGTLSEIGVMELLAPQMDQIGPELFANVLGKVTTYLDTLGQQKGGRIGVNLQVVKARCMVEVQVFKPGQPKPERVELTTLEKFVTKMLTQLHTPHA